VSDKEHVEIIRLYVEENLGMTKIGEKMGALREDHYGSRA